MKQTLLFILASLLCITNVPAQWTTVCNTGDGMIVNLTKYHDDLYATGFFTTACGTSAAHVARWDGSAWAPLGTGLSDAGHNLRALDTALYLAQYQQTMDSNWIRRWDGSSFVKVGEGVYLTTATSMSNVPNLYDVILYRGHLVACGEFDVVGDRHISGIMQWTGSQWDSLGSGLAGAMGSSGVMYPHQLLVIDTSLYVVGNFTTAGGITANGVARWDGTQWHAVGAGFNGTAYGLGMVNGSLYAGGEFTASGSTTLKGIARWDGTQWVNPGFGVSYSIAGVKAYIHTIEQVGAYGIFEGGFNRAADGAATRIANNVIAYDGTSLDTMGGGVVSANFEGIMATDSGVLVGGALFPGSAPETTNVSFYHFRLLNILEEKAAEVSVTPNPFSSFINISGIAPGSRVCICNLTGRMVYEETVASATATMQLGWLPDGIYILQMTNGSDIRYARIIKAGNQ